MATIGGTLTHSVRLEGFAKPSSTKFLDYFLKKARFFGVKRLDFDRIGTATGFSSSLSDSTFAGGDPLSLTRITTR